MAVPVNIGRSSNITVIGLVVDIFEPILEGFFYLSECVAGLRNGVIVSLLSRVGKCGAPHVVN
ncbi:hypothetical protein D3C72_1973410 [compost metagenome]